MLGSWESLYRSDAQGMWALIVVPIVFLAWVLLRGRPIRGAVPGTESFVQAWAVVFAIETILDPVATGPALRWLGITQGPVAEYAMIPFVLLGDFRVFVLRERLAAPSAGTGAAIRRAAGWTLVVPVTAVVVTAALLAALGTVPSMTVWLAYEVAFAVVALVLRARTTVPYLRTVLAYVVAYYVLWAAADVIILSGSDLGWALRVVPNQLYYAWWLPFAYGRFVSAQRLREVVQRPVAPAPRPAREVETPRRHVAEQERVQ